MHRIIFYDGVTPAPYTPESLNQGNIGGTEATVLRVSQGLVSRGHKVTLIQRKDKTSSIQDHPVVFNYSEEVTDPDLVVTLRDAGHYANNKLRYPKAKHVLWMHDVVDPVYAEHLEHHLRGQDALIVGVSDWHVSQMQQALRVTSKIRFKRIYNPLAEYCKRDSTSVDPFKLIFTSSPHKGLKQVLELFSRIYAKDSRFKLYIANPGYFPDATELPLGVVPLGSLPHKEVVDHVRSSLCLFYPQTTFPETFGLVLAEANAVGTPVIAHPIGAAPEVLDFRQVMDCYDLGLVISKVLEYSKGKRLRVRGNPAFELSVVVKAWEEI